MSAINTSDSQDTGLAPAPLENQGNDDFSSMLSGEPQKPDTSGNIDQVSNDPSKPPAPLSKPAGKDPVQSQTGTTPAQQAAPQQTQQTGIDPKLIAEIVEASHRGMQQSKGEVRQQTKDAAEMTPEQFNQKYGIVQVTPEHIAQLLDADPKKAAMALNNLLINNTRSAVLMAKDIIEAQLKQARAEYEPHVMSWQSYQAKAAEDARQNKFYTKYPQLANEKELVQEMIDSLTAKKQAGMVEFQTEDQVFQAVADASMKLLARMNKQAAPAQGTTATNTNGSQASTRQMASAASPGRSGTGQATKVSDEEAVFGSDFR